MKVFVLIAVVALLSGANAGSFTDFLHKIGDEIKNTLSSVGNTMKPLATNLLSSLLDTAKTQGSKLLGGLVSSLTNVLSTAPSSKRDLAAIMSFFEKGKSAIENIADTIKHVFHAAMTKLSSIEEKIKSLRFLQEPVENVIQEIKDVVSVHGQIQLSNIIDLLKDPTEFVKKIGGDFLRNLLHKRSTVGDMVFSFGQNLKDLFQPFVDAALQHVSSFGEKLVSTASGVASMMPL